MARKKPKGTVIEGVRQALQRRLDESYQRGLFEGQTQGALRERKLIDADAQKQRTLALTRLIDAYAELARAGATIVGELGPRAL